MNHGSLFGIGQLPMPGMSQSPPLLSSKMRSSRRCDMVDTSFKMGAVIYAFVALLLLAVFQHGEAIMCHRCYSAMGGCSDHVVWRMYPWRECGNEFCVKVIEKVPGEEPRYLRDCEHNLLKSARHRLRMPVLRRHGYCLPARKNDPFNPLDSTDSRFTYCFCNDWNGCNTAGHTQVCLPLLGLISGFVSLLLWRSL